MSVEVMSGGGGSPKLQTKTVTPSASKQSVTPDTEYDGLSEVTINAAPLQSKTVTPSTSSQIIKPDSSNIGLSQVTVNAMPSGALNTPTVSSSGLVTASVGTSGYLSSGTSKTLQLTTKSSSIITPTTYSQTAVSSGVYTTGAVTVSGDSNLVSGNIASGVSIFGVLGTYTGSGKYKSFFGTVNNTSESAYLTLSTTGEYITSDKIKSILIFTQYGIETSSSTPTYLWMYVPFVNSNRVYVNTGSDGISEYSQNIMINPQYGYIQAGWTTTSWNSFGDVPYNYIVVADA